MAIEGLFREGRGGQCWAMMTRKMEAIREYWTSLGLRVANCVSWDV